MNELPELVFDRGTLLFKGDWPPHVANLRGVIFDPRVRAFRASPHEWPTVVEALGRAAITFTDRVAAFLEPTGSWTAIELRPYQETGLRAWEIAGRRGIVVLPTGAGKTRTALAAIARLRVATICLVPTRVLLEQWRSELRRYLEGPIGCYGDGARELAAITVATFESAYRHMDELGNRFGFIVVDEAHHFGTSVRDEALEMCIAPARLGLTATPSRDGAALHMLGRLLGPISYELAISDLAGTFLANFELMVLQLELAPEERTLYDSDAAIYRSAVRRFMRAAPGASWAEFARAASASDEGRAALAAWRRVRRLLAFTKAKSEAVAVLLARHSDARVLVFTADNATAYAVSRRHLIMPLTCDIGRKERDDALGRFRRGELRALVSARVLNEGLDVPDADVAIVVGGALGAREHVQRIGRLLRPSPGKHAVVYELVTRNTIEVKQAKRRREGLGAGTTAAIRSP